MKLFGSCVSKAGGNFPPTSLTLGIFIMQRFSSRYTTFWLGILGSLGMLWILCHRNMITEESISRLPQEIFEITCLFYLNNYLIIKQNPQAIINIKNCLKKGLYHVVFKQNFSGFFEILMAFSER